MTVNSTEKQLNELFNSGKSNDDRIEKLMHLIESETLDANQRLTSRVVKYKFRYFKSLAAALIISFILFVPIGGTSFAGSIIEWVKETIIQTENGFLAASDGKVEGEIELSEYTTIVFSSQEEMLEHMGDRRFQMPEMPEGFVFNESKAFIYDEVLASIYFFNYSTKLNGFEVNGIDPQFSISVHIDDTEILPGQIIESLGMKVIGENLKSAKIDFMDGEALFMNHDDHYTIGAPTIKTIDTDTFTREVRIGISYKYIEGDVLWEKGLQMLEDIYRQYEEYE